MRRETGQRDGRTGGGVPRRLTPSESRARAAARLTGAPSGADTVRRRTSEAARAADRASLDRPDSRPARRTAPQPGERRAAESRSARRQPAEQRSPESRSPRPPSRARAIADPSAMAGIFSSGSAGLAAAPAQPAPQEQPRPRHLKVVEPGTLSPRQRRRRARAALMAVIAAGSFIAFALVYLHVVLAQRQFHIDRLNSDVAKAQTSYQNLRLQVAQLGSPQQIISTAEGRLGMVQPQKVMYLTPPAGTAATGQTASPAPGASSTAPAPAGNADWPLIKSQLAGAP